MRKISFLVLVYFLTTAGLFKSALEECADIEIRDESQFNEVGIYEWVEMNDAEKLVAKKDWEKRAKEYELYKKKNPRSIKVTMYEMYGFGDPQTHKKILIREITKKENDKKYNKFISQSLKIKMNDRLSGYPEQYSRCVNYKKSNPELFESIYN